MSPRQVDHEARRAEIVRAAVDLVTADGREAATVRALARATGWSTGAVRHYVPSSAALESLLLDAFSAAVQQRVTTVLIDWPPAPRTSASVRAVVVRCLEQLLPLDDERRVEHQVWLDFWGRDRDAAEAGWVWEGTRAFHRQIVLLLAGAETAPTVPAALAPPLEQLAAESQAYVDGLALRAAFAVPPESPQQTLAALEAFVARLQRDLLD